jgi:hypothetical protein
MNKLSVLMVAASMAVACGSPNQTSAPPTPAAAPAAAAQPYANLAQVMRGIPFPNSNIIFDTQSNDPGAQAKPAEGGGDKGATASYSSVYGGWQAVENAALALSETANLITIPGRLCENGKPAPVDREDYKKFAAGLAEAGKAAFAAAQSKNLDMMVDVSGTVAEACANCHEVYRDKDNNADRCI